MKNFIFPLILLALALPDFAFACDVPFNLQATSTGTSAVLTWTAQSGATSYHLEVEDANNNPIHFFAETTVSGTTYTVTGLTPGQSYKFKVRSNCGGDHSDWSDWFYFTTSSLVATQDVAVGTNAVIKIMPTIVHTGDFQLSLAGFQARDVSVRLMDVTGKICMETYVHTGDHDSTQTIVLPAGINPGMYYLQVRSAHEQLVSRLFVAAE